MQFISIMSLISLLIPRRFEGIVEHYTLPEDPKQLYKIHSFMKMKNLLQILKNNTTSIPKKMQHIDQFNNEFHEISLPSTTHSISGPNITTAGLLDDWNFELFFSN
jgi:hypothetical protein